jgi:hypothetical protein
MFKLSRSIPNSESESFITPKEADIPPSQTSTPPVQIYKRKSRSKLSQTSKPRRSARLESGSASSKKPTIDTSIYEIMDSESDEEETPSPPRQTKSISQIVEPSKPTETSQSEPIKPKTIKSAFLSNIERFVADGKQQHKKAAEKALKEAEEKALREAEERSLRKGKRKEPEEQTKAQSKQPEEEEPPIINLFPKNRVIPVPLVHPSTK